MLRGKICRGQNLMAPKGRKHIKVWPEGQRYTAAAVRATLHRSMPEKLLLLILSFTVSFPNPHMYSMIFSGVASIVGFYSRIMQ